MTDLMSTLYDYVLTQSESYLAVYPEYPDFCRRAGEASRAQTKFIDNGPWPGDQLIYFTCQPWFPITSLTNERDLNPEDSVPRVAWGKYAEKDGRLVLSMSLELNHRLLDGVHVGRFYEALNRWMEGL